MQASQEGFLGEAASPAAAHLELGSGLRCGFCGADEGHTCGRPLVQCSTRPRGAGLWPPPVASHGGPAPSGPGGGHVSNGCCTNRHIRPGWGGGAHPLLIFMKTSAPSFKSLININSQLNIYMKAVASPPPPGTCLKLGLGVGVGTGSAGRAWGLEALTWACSGDPCRELACTCPWGAQLPRAVCADPSGPSQTSHGQDCARLRMPHCKLLPREIHQPRTRSCDLPGHGHGGGFGRRSEVG